MEPTVFLFDLDGVMVKPGGYRAAVRATVNHFTNQLGLGDLAPDDETVAIFEAQGITCEWDMVPLLLTLTLEAAAARLGRPVSWASFQAACDELRARPLEPLVIDFAPLLRALGRYVQPGQAPSDTVLLASQDGASPFPLLAGQGVLAELLSHTRRLEHSRTSRVFETFALGDEFYAKAMGLPAEVRSESLLDKYDRPLLSGETRDRLRLLRDSSGLRMAAYTARPSIPTSPIGELLAIFSPEGEMALNCIGWHELILIGSGQAGEAAHQLGEHEERLIKPAPYHAIAAAAAAWTGDRQAALEWMQQVFCFAERQADPPPLETPAGDLPPRLNLHIFEDSPAGMRGGLGAVQLLAQLGMQVSLSLWGISSHPEKAAALRSVGAQVYADVNQAVAAALDSVSAASY